MLNDAENKKNDKIIIDALVGKTVSGVIDKDFYMGITIAFTDGTVIDITPTDDGYGCDLLDIDINGEPVDY